MLNQSLPRGIRFTLIGSGVVHAGVVVALIAGTAGSSRSQSRVETVITTKLVRLGKERPKELLPRKHRPPPPPPPRAAVSDAKAAAPGPKKSARDRISEMSSLSNALSRAKKTSDEEPEGHPDGSPDGESTLQQALIGNRYQNEIGLCAHKYFTVEGVSPDKIRNRKATIYVRIKADGSFFDFKVEKGSGLKAFDRAAERAVKRCGKVSKPPKEIFKQVHDEGVEIEFTDKTLK